MIVGSILL